MYRRCSCCSVIPHSLLACLRTAQPSRYHLAIPSSILHLEGTRLPEAGTSSLWLRRRSPSPNGKGLLFIIGIVDVIDEADHHLLPCLLAPVNRLFGVGVVLVPVRIVEVGGAVNAGPGGQGQQLLQPVDRLPVE